MLLLPVLCVMHFPAMPGMSSAWTDASARWACTARAQMPSCGPCCSSGSLQTCCRTQASAQRSSTARRVLPLVERCRLAGTDHSCCGMRPRKEPAVPSKTIANASCLRVHVWQGGASRVDFILDTAAGGEMYVEVKSVTLAEPVLTRAANGPPAAGGSMQGDWIALFPDTVSDRAQRHVRELMSVVAAGKQAAVRPAPSLLAHARGLPLAAYMAVLHSACVQRWTHSMACSRPSR